MAAKSKTNVEETVVDAAVVEETPVKKTRTRKTAAKTEETGEAAAPKKRTTKTAKKEPEVFVQWWGKEVSAQELVDRVKAIWTEEMGKKATEMKDLKIYLKPEENAAHYVINEEIFGHIEV